MLLGYTFEPRPNGPVLSIYSRLSCNLRFIKKHSKNQFDKRKQDWLVQKFGLRWFQGSSRRVHEQLHNRPCSRCPPSLHALKDWWIKSMSRGFSGGKQVINSSNTRNCSRVCLFLTTENEQLSILKTITANYGWKWSVVTVDVLTVSNNDVNFVETKTVHFAWPLNRCFVLRE